MEKLGKEWTFLPASRGKLHQQKGRWDASELCLVEMDRLCLSENMASVSQSLDYFPVCSLHSAASRRTRASQQTGECAARVRVTARARRWYRKIRAWLIVPTSDWIRPQRRPTFRPTRTLCKWPSGRNSRKSPGRVCGWWCGCLLWSDGWKMLPDGWCNTSDCHCLCVNQS